MTQEIIVKRLSLIKYLYQTAITQSRQQETIAFISILSFHDSIDMFVQLAAQKKNIKRKGQTFLMNYFSLIPELTHEASVKKINDRRNSLKHNGQIPAKIEIEESRTIASLFFEENTKIVFGVEFKDISLFDLVVYPKV